jgi:DNA-nicking Smr family endonuclease
LRGADRGGRRLHPAGHDGQAGGLKRIPVEDSFDLHSFRPEDALSAATEYLREAKSAGFREVRLIHGKGIGVRRAEVRRLLASLPDVAAYGDAPPERGGMGATLVVFR